MQRIQDMFINMEEVAEDAYKDTELLLSLCEVLILLGLTRF